MLAQTLATVERREEFESTIKSYKRLKNKIDSLIGPNDDSEYSSIPLQTRPKSSKRSEKLANKEE